MARSIRGLVVLFAALVLGGCAIKPIVASGPLCEFKSYQLNVENPAGFGDVSAAGGASTFGDLLNQALFQPGVADATAPSQSTLFMSGGSLHGAFGAGFLSDWKRASPGGKLPDFKVVTGISTGSILATFAFLDDPDKAVAGYTINSESELLKPFGEVKNGEPGLSSYVALLKKGALADLAPLRVRLRSFIDDATLRKVAAEGARGRLLFAGVVDVDTGQAVVLDLTDMAAQYVAATGEVQTRKHDCYVEGILASSSAPLAALPVFIDNRMYIDGGARFGMFSDELGAQIERTSDSSGKPTVYLLINGDQEIAAKCGKADPADCPGGLDPPGNYKGAHDKWSFTGLALRSEGILANQIYRFSASHVAQQAKDRGVAFRLIKIDNGLLGHRFPRGADGQPTADAKTCADWRTIDRAATPSPLQFYPNYMRCVIDYGRTRVPVEMAKWGTAAGPF